MAQTMFSRNSLGSTTTSDSGQFNSLKFRKTKDFGDFQILSNSPEKAKIEPTERKRPAISKKPTKKRIEHVDV